MGLNCEVGESNKTECFGVNGTKWILGIGRDEAIFSLLEFTSNSNLAKLRIDQWLADNQVVLPPNTTYTVTYQAEFDMFFINFTMGDNNEQY